MTNPWMKKNPFMSMWLSGANAVANRARGHATTAAKQQSGKIIKQVARFGIRTWLAAVTPRER
jgi:hypothetical protein